MRLQRGAASAAAQERFLCGGLGDQALALCLLAGELPGPADGFALLAHLLLGGLLIGPPPLHLAKNAFALQLLFQDPEGLLDVVFTDENLQRNLLLRWLLASVVKWSAASKRRKGHAGPNAVGCRLKECGID